MGNLGVRLSLAMAFWLANALLHRQVSDLLDGRWDTPFGTIAAVHGATYALYAATPLFAAWLVVRIAAGGQKLLAAAAWCLLAGAIALCHFTLVTIAVEAVHYPQYALIALAFAYVLDPKRQKRLVLEPLLIVAVLSAGDEALQYLYLMDGQSYFDFNDLLLNQLGILAGLLFYYGFPRQRLATRSARPLLKALLTGYAIAAIAVAAATASGILIAKPDAAFAGSALATDEGLRIYLQLERAAHAAWMNSRSGGVYYVLGALGWLASFLATLAAGWLVEKRQRW